MVSSLPLLPRESTVSAKENTDRKKKKIKYIPYKVYIPHDKVYTSVQISEVFHQVINKYFSFILDAEKYP